MTLEAYGRPRAPTIAVRFGYVKTLDVKQLERRLASASTNGELDQLTIELRDCVLEVAVACNVVELSPMARLVRGSQAHRRMRHRLERLTSRLDTIEARRRDVDDVLDAA